MIPEKQTIPFSYKNEYSDEQTSSFLHADDFEAAETYDDFAEFDDDQDLYGDYDSDEDDEKLDASDSDSPF